MTWTYAPSGKQPQLSNPVVIEGLPGVGNCGKVAVDFLVDASKAVKIGEFHSFQYPHSAFVNEKNIIELPRIELHAAPARDALFLVGDVQPINEESCYAFCECALNVFKQMNASLLVTMGGIGLRSPPKKPKIYCCGTGKKATERFLKAANVERDLYGYVGPIIGVTGVLAGLAGRRGIPAAVLLAETHGHPMHLGVKGARELLRVVNSALGLKLNVKDLEKDIMELEEELLKRTREVQAMRKPRGPQAAEDTSYIG